VTTSAIAARALRPNKKLKILDDNQGAQNGFERSAASSRGQKRFDGLGFL